MEPKILTRDAITVMGILEPCKFDEPGFFDTLWRQHFMPYEAQIRPLSPDKGYYAAYLCPGPGCPVDVLAGMAVDYTGEPPAGLVVRQLPAALYAVCETTMQGIGQAWNAMYEQWLPSSAYEHSPAPDLEYYPPATEPGEARALVCVAIQAKAV